MDFRIADTFTASLARLPGEEQKLAKTTAFDLQLNPANPGHQFHKLDKAKDPHFWSVRVGRDVRLIVHRTPASLLLCYVDRHDDAYRWAERRRIETHPKTGAAQLVEIRQVVEEIPVALPKVAAPAVDYKAVPNQLPLFANQTDDDLLSFGVPPDWLAEVKLADEDGLFALADHLPAEAAEALLELAVGGRPKPKVPPAPTADPFAHPDALRRFRSVATPAELEEALGYPWERWAVFLHPDQRDLVEREYNGPARISGSAGTGKTVVALHRAVHLATTNPNATVLLTTFSLVLASQLRLKIRRLLASDPRVGERIQVTDIEEVARRLYESAHGKARIAEAGQIRDMLAAAEPPPNAPKFGPRFLAAEWAEVVDAWQIESWEGYRDVKRLGRKTRLPEAQRQRLWAIFEQVLDELRQLNLMTPAAIFSKLAEELPLRRNPPFDFLVVDEAQDVSVPQLRFVAALAAGRPNALFFTGDLGQRIFQIPFSWLSLGVDVRGRSRTLKVNYRTSHQIRTQADRLLAASVSDADGIVEDRTGTISVFDGPEPTVHLSGTSPDEANYVAKWLKGQTPGETCVIVRSDAQLDRAKDAVETAGLLHLTLDGKTEPRAGQVSIATMHMAKGLEFRAVAVMACDDEIVPLQERIDTVSDPSDLDEVYNTERHLLYVACTRPRDHLLVTSGGNPSEFLDDLKPRTT